MEQWILKEYIKDYEWKCKTDKHLAETIKSCKVWDWFGMFEDALADDGNELREVVHYIRLEYGSNKELRQRIDTAIDAWRKLAA